MPNKNAMKIIAIYITIKPATAVFAHDLHDGQGVFGSHWHAADVIAYVVFAIVVALALWLSRGDK